MEGNGVD
uniref:Uncharacterized protein n=1 Tax=Oryza barthii TaxID=65489 RepID=A0A1Y8Z4K2_9ORYZ